MLTLAAWVHDLNPFVWRISSAVGVRWYGLAYIAGFACAWLLLHVLAKRRLSLLKPEAVPDAMLALVIGVLVGGRLGYVVFYDPGLLVEFTSSPPWWGLLAINRGGMASHGGMVGVAAACWAIGRRERIPFLHLLDLVALVAPIGLFFGRVANFINGELLGAVVAPPGRPGPWWTVKFPQELATHHRPALDPDQVNRLEAILDRVAQPGDNYDKAVERLVSAIQHGNATLKNDLAPLLASRHPSQLYQAFAEGIVLFATLWLIWARPRKPGVIGAWFLIVYGVLRIATEIWRLPDDTLAVQRILGLSRGQWLSVVMVVIGVVLLALASRRDAAKLGGWAASKAANAEGQGTRRSD